MFKKNVKFKVLSLVVALIIWAYASEGRNPRMTREIREIPLEVRRVEPGLVVTSAPRSVRVVLEGARSYVNTVAAEPDAITAYVNLTNKDTGRHAVPVIVRLPNGFGGLVTATSTPPEVSVSLARKLERAMDIKVQFVDSPPVGYRFGAPFISPSRSVVSGMAQSVNQVDQVLIAVDGGSMTKESIDGEFPLIALDKDGKAVQGVILTPEKVRLRLDLLEAPASRAVFVSLDTSGQPPFPHRVAGIEVSPQTVTVTGRPERLMDVTTLKTETVNLSNHYKTFTQRVRVIVPQGLTVVGSDYVRATVKIEAAPITVPQPESSEPDTGGEH